MNWNPFSRLQESDTSSDVEEAWSVDDYQESVDDRLRGLREELGQKNNNVELLQEQIAELELGMEDIGWQRHTEAGDREFSTRGLRKLRKLARLSYLKNPLIKNAVRIQAHYVWGQGFSVSASDPDVNSVIQDFLSNPKNKKALTGHAARVEKEKEVQVHGELFIPMFTSAVTGRVNIRNIFPDEIEQIICNPEDYTEPWFYKRVYSQENFNEDSGSITTHEKTVYYPDWRLIYTNKPQPATFGDDEIMWDAPIYHVKTGGFGDMKRGVPEVYAALDWARAVKEDLENYATVKRALARFAFKMNVKGGKGAVSATKSRLSSTLNTDGLGMMETNPSPLVGSTFIGSDGWSMDPIKTAGSQPSPDEGHRLWLMVSAGTGIPETILTGNADVGNLATAKTLDRPTELQMRDRQTLWADIYDDILNYVIDMVALAPDGVLNGTKVVDEETDEWIVELDDETDRFINITFPAILERDVFQIVQAIVWATTLNNGVSAGVLSDQTVSRLLLSALGEDDIDQLLDEIYPEDTVSFDAGKPAAAPAAAVAHPSGYTPELGVTAQGPTMDDPTSTEIAVSAALRSFVDNAPDEIRNELREAMRGGKKLTMKRPDKPRGAHNTRVRR